MKNTLELSESAHMPSLPEIVLAKIKAHVQAGNPAETIHDSLHRFGYDVDYNEYRRLTAAIQRRLKEGGPNHDMLGQYVLLNPHTRGRFATGYGANPPVGENQNPLPSSRVATRWHRSMTSSRRTASTCR